MRNAVNRHTRYLLRVIPVNVPITASRHAFTAREAKREAARAIGVDEAFISSLVDRFYARVRDDALLGPIFDERIEDWPFHLDRMKRFWRSVLHNSGEFSGSPMAKHAIIPGLDAGHFDRWLRLFYATLREDEPADEATRLVAAKARMIAESLLTGLAMKRDGLAQAGIGKDLPHA